MVINSTTAVCGDDDQTGPPGDEERGPSGPRVRPSVPVDLNQITAGVTPHLTVIVPTRNEEQNVARLLERLGPAVEPLGAEIVFVDDSDDGTPEALAEYIRCCTPENIHAVCEDYRAAVGIDLVHDEADLGTKLSIPMLVLWGRYDPSFLVAGAEAYRKDVPGAEVHVLDAGHFALDEQAGEVIRLTEAFMRKLRGQ